MKGCKNAKNNDLQLLLFPSNQSRKEKQHTSPSFIPLTASCAASSCQFGCYDMEAEALIGRAGRGTRHVSIHICFFVCATKRRLRNETAHVPVDALSTPCCAASSPPDAVVRCDVLRCDWLLRRVVLWYGGCVVSVYMLLDLVLRL